MIYQGKAYVSDHHEKLRERRRAERVQPGPLGVRLFRNEGTLIDISPKGARVRLPRPETPGKQITPILDWNDEAVLLRGRVIWCAPHRVELPNAVLGRTEHHVAFEFAALPERSVEALTRLLARTET
jgi:hypothetical protein